MAGTIFDLIVRSAARTCGLIVTLMILAGAWRDLKAKGASSRDKVFCKVLIVLGVIAVFVLNGV